jgi:quinol monooxygenase YgiN
MLSVVADIQVDPSSAERWKALFFARAKEVRATEPGTLLYTLTQAATPGSFTVIELVCPCSAA